MFKINRLLAGALAAALAVGQCYAEPFYFSTEDKAAGRLQYSWSLNGTNTQGPRTAQGEMTLRQSGAGQGNASLTVALQNVSNSKILQAAQETLAIVFGAQQQNSSFFGL